MNYFTKIKQVDNKPMLFYGLIDQRIFYNLDSMGTGSGKQILVKI